jgi:hypothetical protein
MLKLPEEGAMEAEAAIALHVLLSGLSAKMGNRKGSECVNIGLLQGITLFSHSGPEG